MPHILSVLLIAATSGIFSLMPLAHANTDAWNGLWFQCEFSGRHAPPGDDCAMLDDDGLLLEHGQVTHMRVIDSPETTACKKERVGQCVRADEPAITVAASRKGRAEFIGAAIGFRFLGCTQIFHIKKISTFFEARPDKDRCIWAGEKYFYLRKYDGIIRIEN